MTLTRKICTLALGGVATSSAPAFVASTFRTENKEHAVNKATAEAKSAGYLEWGPNGLGTNNGTDSRSGGEAMDIF